MSKRLYFLVSIVLLLCLGSAAQAAPIDVNNFSFEYDINGLQITEQRGCGHLKGWRYRNEIVWWPAADNYMFATVGLNYDGFQATDGNVAFVSFTIDVEPNDICQIYQVLEDANAVIKENHRYTLTFDAINPSETVLSHDVNAGLFYSLGGVNTPSVNDVTLASSRTPLPNTSGDYSHWEVVTLYYTALSGASSIGERLAVRLSVPGWPDWPEGHSNLIDNVRVEGGWASDAWNPIPADKAINIPLDLATLSWSPGLWADKHNVYFGTNFEDVSNREPSTLITPEPTEAESIAVPMTLQLGGEYFWMVVEVNDSYVQEFPESMPPAGPWVGPVWSFKTNDGKAYNFNPRNKERNVPVDVVLKWNPGAAADTHDLYLGTNYDDVEGRSSAAHVAELIDPNYWSSAPNDLDLARTYYWAVDEVNEPVAGSPWQGMVLSFTVIGYRIVDDMESYESGSSTNDIFHTWIDGWDPDNGSQSEITLNIEPNYTQGVDGNSMKYYYRNSESPHYSETTHAFSPAQDWTEARLEGLVLYFRADMANESDAIQPMYVSVSDGTDTGIVEYESPSDLYDGWAGWQEWNIDLQDFADAGVELSNVTEMGIKIGDGNEAGDGYVYFDNIRLYPPRCIADEAAGNFTVYDCDVDIYDLEILARDWLMSGIGNVTATAGPSDANLFGRWPMDDSSSSGGDKALVLDVSGNENHGTLYDLDNKPGASTYKHHTDDSIEGTGALVFEGEDSYVEIPAMNTSTNTVTITAWIKRELKGNIYEGIVVSSNYRDACEPNYTAGLEFGSETTDWSPNYELSYLWTGDSWEWRSGLFVPAERWSFVALTVAPEVATLYLYDGICLRAAKNYDNHEPKPWDAKFHIANQMQYEPGTGLSFHGAIDDVRIYNYTLRPEEILSLALWGQGSQYLPLEAWRANTNPDEDDIVDLKDFAIMADNWLTEVLWP